MTCFCFFVIEEGVHWGGIFMGWNFVWLKSCKFKCIFTVEILSVFFFLLIKEAVNLGAFLGLKFWLTGLGGVGRRGMVDRWGDLGWFARSPGDLPAIGGNVARSIGDSAQDGFSPARAKWSQRASSSPPSGARLAKSSSKWSRRSYNRPSRYIS